jgi:hypothetical protein
MLQPPPGRPQPTNAGVDADADTRALALSALNRNNAELLSSSTTDSAVRSTSMSLVVTTSLSLSEPINLSGCRAAMLQRRGDSSGDVQSPHPHRSGGREAQKHPLAGARPATIRAFLRQRLSAPGSASVW